MRLPASSYPWRTSRSNATAAPSSSSVGRDPIGLGLHNRSGLAHTYGETGRSQHGNVILVVANGEYTLGVDAEPLRQQPECVALVGRRRGSLHQQLV